MSGKWIERSPMYLSLDIYTCNYCGKNVPRSVWLEGIEGDTVPFCSPEIAALYLQTREHQTNTRRPEYAKSLTEEHREMRIACVALRDRRETQTNSTNGIQKGSKDL